MDAFPGPNHQSYSAAPRDATISKMSSMHPQTDNDVDVSSASNSFSTNQMTVTIFDWDDTLCPSSYLFLAGFRLESDLTDEIRAELLVLESYVINVIERAYSYGDVFIVTNAQTGWVELSARKFLPGVVPLLAKTKVLSARSTFETTFPKCPLSWKFYAFRECLASCFSYKKGARNIMSFGDSHYEREAVHAVTRGHSNTCTKSIKFSERPTTDQLRRQLDLVTSSFDSIHAHEKNLDLMLTITYDNNNFQHISEDYSSSTGQVADVMSGAIASEVAPEGSDITAQA